MEEGSFNETLQDHQEVESSVEDKETVVEAAANDHASNETPDGDIAIKEEKATQSEENVEVIESGKVEETGDVSESVAESFEKNKVASDTVKLESKEEEREGVVSPEDPDGLSLLATIANEAELHASEDRNGPSLVSENASSKETETVKDMTVAEEEKNVIVLSSVVTDEEPSDVASEETTRETSIPKSDEEPTDVASKETVKDMTVNKGGKDVIVLSSVVTDEEPIDVASKETAIETSIQKSEEPTDVASKKTSIETSIQKSEEEPTDVASKEVTEGGRDVIVLSSVVTDEEPIDVASKETAKETSIQKSEKEPTDVASKKTAIETSIQKSEEEPTDVAPKETLGTNIPKSDECDEVPPIITGKVPKGIEESLVPSTDDKVEEQSYVQGESSYGSANNSFQQSVVVPDAGRTSATVEENTILPRDIENQIIVPVIQRQHASWNSCCGLFEIIRGGDR